MDSYYEFANQEFNQCNNVSVIPISIRYKGDETVESMIENEIVEDTYLWGVDRLPIINKNLSWIKKSLPPKSGKNLN